MSGGLSFFSLENKAKHDVAARIHSIDVINTIEGGMRQGQDLKQNQSHSRLGAGCERVGGAHSTEQRFEGP